METTASLTAVTCTDCGHEPSLDERLHRCPDCGGVYTVSYDLDALPASFGRFDGIGRYESVFPVPRSSLVTMDEGTTPLIECPSLADSWGVDAVHVKDEGANPTGSLADRSVAVATSVAVQQGADAVALPSTGPDGQAVAAYGARAGLDVEVFVPSRSAFDAKAMINVHGGEMTVVGGRYGDAVDAFEAEAGDAYSLAPFDAPFRVEGAKTVAYEVCEQLDWQAPDAIVYPTGHGESLVGIARGFRELRAAGRIETLPRLVLAQAEGCAPLVKAWDEGQDRPTAWDRPDTICGPLEVPEPDSDGGALALDGVAESNGIADVAADADALAAAVEVAGTVGVEMSATGGVAAAVTQSLAEDGTLSVDDTVVAINPLAGEKEADVLRSHLMSKGI